MRQDDVSAVSEPRSSYVTGRTCLIGSAAHPMPPFHQHHSSATATALAAEEALVLSALLGRAGGGGGGGGGSNGSGSDSDDRGAVIAAALRAYDHACRPRAERAARAAFETTALLAGRAPGVGVDPGRLAAALSVTTTTTTTTTCGEEGRGGGEGLDVPVHVAAAVGVMEQILPGRALG